MQGPDLAVSVAIQGVVGKVTGHGTLPHHIPLDNLLYKAVVNVAQCGEALAFQWLAKPLDTNRAFDAVEG